MPELPSGTVTFLFTDIERSTKELEGMGNVAYADALDEHRRLLRDAFAAHGGHEIGTEGDAFFVAFARANDAVEAAVQGQLSLGPHPLRVRMGIHTGEALVRGDDYVGHDVHKAKRICDAGHGGQILLSQTTMDLVGSNARLIDLGPHRLKDLGEAQRLFQLRVDGLIDDFPPLRSLEHFTHNLPLQRSTFVGRESAIAEVRKLLDANRLVTLTGVGGCGKTRLALQVGAELLDHYPDGVFFADLAPVSDPDGVTTAVATAVGVPIGSAGGSTPGAPTGKLLYDFLAPRACLVIVDNCEHLLDECAEIVDSVLARCPDVVVLATSREGLDVEGEQSWRVPSLSTPVSSIDAQESEAVSLFMARAQAVQPGFDLTPANVEAVADICRRLDGIPLAIEFAASRVSHMSPREIADRLGDMFKLLTGGRRRVQRQQTLQATLDWSYELLSEAERTLLSRLAVFAGDFALRAVEGICGGDGLDPGRMLDLLASLVQKSLVSVDVGEGGTRYKLLETVRLYASEKLRETGQSDRYRARHRDWYLAWAESEPWERCYYSDVLARAFEMEHANLSAALEWSVAEDRLDIMGRLACRVGALWFQFGHAEEGHRWLTLARPEDLDLDADLKTSWLAAIGFAASMQLDTGTPLALLDRAVEASVARPSVPRIEAVERRALLHGVVAEATRDDDLKRASRQESDDAIELAQGFPAICSAAAGYWRANLEMVLRDIPASVSFLEESLNGFDPIENESWLSATHLCLATAAHVLGDHTRAQNHARQITSTDAFWGWHAGRAVALAVTAAATGDIEGARQVLTDNIDIVSRSGVPGDLEELMVGFAAVALLGGDAERASRLLGFVRARVFDQGRISRSTAAYALYVHYARRVRETLDRETAQRLRVEGGAMPKDEAIAYALGLPT